MILNIKYNRKHIIGFTAILALLLTLNSCATFIPSYDAKIAEQVGETSKIVDLFYLSMLEMTTETNNSREYKKYAKDYVLIEVELNALYNKNKVRPLNKNSTRICEITLQLWQKYKEIHKNDNVLNNGQLIFNRKIFDDLFEAMQVAEKAKDIISNPPE